MNTQQIWQAVLGDLELSLSKANFTTWFKGTFILELDDKSVIIGVPNAFTKSWLEKKYASEILKALRNMTETSLKEILFKVASLKQGGEPKEIISPTEEKALEDKQFVEKMNRQKETPATQAYGLNPKYTFSTFIVGKNNELAKAASLAVAANPGIT